MSSALKRARTHADEFKDFEDLAPPDYDPEDEPPSPDSDNDESEPENEPNQDRAAAREHYQPVAKSALRRQRDPAALGPQYAGSKISRSRMDVDGDEHDPLAEYASDEESDVLDDMEVDENNGASTGNSDEDSDIDEIPSEDDDDDNDAATDDTSMSDNKDADSSTRLKKPKQHGPDTDRAELRRLLQQQNNVASSISAATQMDAEKGRAVKRQRQTFDALLNTRIRMQQAITAFNQLDTQESQAGDKDTIIAAETAALTLWNNLESLRQILSTKTNDPNDTSSNPSLTIDASTPTSTIWTHMQSREEAAKRTRDATLNKWSRKTTAAATATLQQASSNRRLQPNNAPSHTEPLSAILASHLSTTNMPTLLARTHLNPQPSSTTTTTTETQNQHPTLTYDDSDFYAHLLQDLLTQRQTADLAAAPPSAAQAQTDTMRAHYAAAKAATKARKNVDTKASKGRKLRYTVHEKLLNFMAPEDRGSWGDRQRDELFGSLMGKRSSSGGELADGMAAVDGAEIDYLEDGGTNEEEALMLFRS